MLTTCTQPPISLLFKFTTPLEVLTSSRCDVALFLTYAPSLQTFFYGQLPQQAHQTFQYVTIAPFLLDNVCQYFLYSFVLPKHNKMTLVILFLFLFIVHPPPRLGSLFFNWAATVIHCVFSVWHTNWNINETSSYVELGIFYRNIKLSEYHTGKHPLKFTFKDAKPYSCVWWTQKNWP